MNDAYTVKLRDLLNNEETKALIDKALSTYPIYIKQSKEEYMPSYVPTREELNKKILNHYKYREIGFETVGRFIDELEISMNEIMPRYNQLFFSADQDFNIIFNVDYKRTIESIKSGKNESKLTGSDSTETTTADTSKVNTSASDTSTTTSSVNSNAKTTESDTPQGSLSIAAKDIDSVDYANKINWNKTSSNDTSTNTGSNSAETTTTSSGSNKTSASNNVSTNGSNSENENTLEITKGNFGVVSSQDLILKYRETILNIEQMIINDERITELFMNVF